MNQALQGNLWGKMNPETLVIKTYFLLNDSWCRGIGILFTLMLSSCCRIMNDSEPIHASTLSSK